MDYISVTFLLFISLVVLLYYVLPRKFRWVWLLISSYAFYFFSSIPLSVFLVMSTVVTFFAGILLGRVNDRQEAALTLKENPPSGDEAKRLRAAFQRKKRAIVVAAVVINFLVLGVFKYYNFFAGNINSLLGLLSIEASLPRLDLLMPLGISFYIFQSAGYVIDVYRGRHRPDRNLAKYALFVSFFPQLVQGPIGRYSDLAGQLTEPHRFSFENLRSGFQLMLWGYLKKLIIADRLAVFVSTVFDGGGGFGFFVNTTAMLAYGLQLYCDFSGGIDISRGVAEMMGIKMAENFRRPYFAQTVSEFWRRWHITLSSWARDYVFYPMLLSKRTARLAQRIRKAFGSRAAKILPACLATLVCFLIIGIWHGAAWKYVFYGLYYGSLISLSLICEPYFDRLADRLKINRNCFSWRVFGMLRTLALVTIGRGVTRSGGFMDALTMMKSSLMNWDPWTLYGSTFSDLGLTQKDAVIVFAGIVVLLAVGILQERGLSVRSAINRQNLWFRWALMIAAIAALLIFGVYGAKYSAASFIYAQF